MEYNTTRNHLVMREYGRHVQKMIEYLMSLDDDEKRQKNSKAVIELMGFLNPHLKNVEDFSIMQSQGIKNTTIKKTADRSF